MGMSRGPGRAVDLDGCVQRQQRCWRVRCVVRFSQYAAHGRRVADPHVGYRSERLGQRRQGDIDCRARFDLTMRQERPEPKAAILLVDGVQSAQPAQADQRTWVNQPIAQQQAQRREAGHEPRITGVPLQF